jgi:hypothetical protein
MQPLCIFILLLSKIREVQNIGWIPQADYYQSYPTHFMHHTAIAFNNHKYQLKMLSNKYSNVCPPTAISNLGPGG